MFLPRKNTQKSAKKVENVNFDTLWRPFWIPPFFGGGTLVFELFSTFSSKMGSRGIKWPIYPEFMMIWNYAQKITPYSPPLLLHWSRFVLKWIQNYEEHFFFFLKINVVIPFVQGLSEKIKHVYSQYRASTAFKPQQTLRQLLVAPKTRHPMKRNLVSCIAIHVKDAIKFTLVK